MSMPFETTAISRYAPDALSGSRPVILIEPPS
jgi:hypothetical protein